MAWKTAEHLLFRRRVLKNSEKLTSPLWEEIFGQVCTHSGNRPPLYRSAEMRTPLTIGLFAGARVVVLPERDYARRGASAGAHARGRAHRALRRGLQAGAGERDGVSSGSTLWSGWPCAAAPTTCELSCDESVTLGADEAERRRYADLLLSSAGDERGFTTCSLGPGLLPALPAQERNEASREALRRRRDSACGLPAHPQLRADCLRLRRRLGGRADFRR